MVSRTKGGFGWSNLFPKIDNVEIQERCGKNIKQQIEATFKLKEGEFKPLFKSGDRKPGEKGIIED